MERIPLTQGQVAIIDDVDYGWIMLHKWYVQKSPRTCYAKRTRTQKDPPGSTVIWMHRVIMHCPAGYDIDHIDHNGLNNQIANLRICTRREN